MIRVGADYQAQIPEYKPGKRKCVCVREPIPFTIYIEVQLQSLLYDLYRAWGGYLLVHK